jgi:hypothetical protein
MIAKPFDAIVAQDLDDLILNQIAEGRTLEFKRELPGSTDSDKKEFLADVSSFANTVGGDLLFGVEESGGAATALVGLPGADIDAEQRRLDSMILAGIEPRIPYSLRPVVTSSGANVLILRVGQSWEAPHRVVFKQHDRFYARSSAGKYALDTGELRLAFIRSANTEESIQRFRDERLVEIGASRVPAPLAEGGRLVLHLVPLQAIAGRTKYDMSSLRSAQQNLIPITASGWNNRITLHGVLSHSSSGYVHLYRSGIVEAVDVALMAPRDGRLVLPSIAFEQRLLQAAKKYFEALQQLGVQPPIYCVVSMLGVKGATMGVDTFRFSSHSLVPLAEQAVAISESVMVDYSESPADVLRAPFDAIWNAFGFEGSPNFNNSGAWRPPS